MIDSFIFFRSYFNSIEALHDDHAKAEVYRIICTYMFDGVIPETDSELALSIFYAHQFNLDNSKRRREASAENGKKGGRPKSTKNNLEQPKITKNNLEKPSDNLEKPNPNLNKNKNENKNKNLNMNLNLNEKLRDSLEGFKEMRKVIKKPLTDVAEQRLMKKLMNMADTDDERAEILDQSTVNCWQGVYPLKDRGYTDRAITVPVYSAEGNPEFNQDRFDELMRRRT